MQGITSRGHLLRATGPKYPTFTTSSVGQIVLLRCHRSEIAIAGDYPSIGSEKTTALSTDLLVTFSRKIYVSPHIDFLIFRGSLSRNTERDHE
jgi:hypothetical protein